MAEVERREVVVVGSGFGGAVTACRLAQAGCDVLVLERGRWWGRGGAPRRPFPRRVDDPWLWKDEDQQGPFDTHCSGGVTAVVAAGVGGGSLLYSNVHLRMPADAFDDDRWPGDWSRDTLAPYYDLVAAMLDLRSIDESTSRWRLPPRTALMAEAAHELGADADFFLPPLAVNLGDPTTRSVNRFGAEQTGCRHCGKCSVGCNHGAKNSLDMNYLPLAQSHGAEIRARCEVTGLAEGYEVTYCDHETGDEHVVQAGSLVLAAGALGTTELLLRHGQALAPDGGLSPRLGEHYSGNGDLVTVALGIQEEWKPTVGPAITAGIVANDRHWFLIEDGGIPPWAVSDVGVRADERDPEEPPLQVIPIVDHAAILLGMGRDTATGRIEAEPDGGGVDIDWPYDDNQSYYDDVKGYHEHLGLALARLAHLDAGPLERVPVSVHSLGGAVMAEDPENGVVDPHGEVFGVPGLFVFDGAAIPTATGVNPSHTIAAVAERNAERLARKLCGDPSWQAPERATAPRHTDPLPTS